MQPAVSIILPTYNRGHLLHGAIKSVQAQTFSDWQLVVIDDGSTDDTAEIVNTFARCDQRVVCRPNAGCSGPAGARNTGIRAAEAGLVAFLDSDDSWEPTKLASFLEVFAAKPATVLVGSNYRIAGSAEGKSTMKAFVLETMVPWWRRYSPASEVIPCERLAADFGLVADAELMLSMTIAGFLWVHTSSAMVRRDAVTRAGLFNERLLRTEDIDLWLKLAQLGPVAYIDQVLATYDLTGRDDVTGSRYDRQDRSRTQTPYSEALHHLRLLERIKRDYSLSPLQAQLLNRRHAAHHLRCLQYAIHERRMMGLRHLLPVMLARDERDVFIRDIGKWMSELRGSRA